MNRTTSLDLTPFIRTAIGLDGIVERFAAQTQHANSSSYPPYNIIAESEYKYRIELAVAGFAENEITVTVEDGILSVAGSKVKDEEAPELNYVYNGISSRSFTREFALADYVEVHSAHVENGILNISLERILPESMKPKQIDVKFR